MDYYELDRMYDLGSFNSDDPKGQGIRTYYGKSADIAKFAKNCTYVKAGSVAYCVDTGEVYMFEDSDKTWYLQ